MARILLALLLTAGGAESPVPTGEVTARVEHMLKSARTRDPVLGGAKDKVSVSGWIPDGVKTVRGGICNPFAKDQPVGKHWKTACRHWQFASVQVVSKP